jgi:hypothetical protein
MSLSERGVQRVEKIVLGICAMDKKTCSKPMKEIMNRIEKTSIFQIKYFSDKVKFEQPVETWPIVSAALVLLTLFFSINYYHDSNHLHLGPCSHRVFLKWFSYGKSGRIHPSSLPFSRE